MLSFISQVAIIVWVVLLALLMRWSVLEIYVMPLPDMLPTILRYDYVLINKIAYGLKFPFSNSYIASWSKPERGDVVLFRTPFNSQYLSIRRVIGVPGDLVLIKDDAVYLNHKKLIHLSAIQRAQDFKWLRDEDFSDEGMTEDKSHYMHLEEYLTPSYAHSILIKKQRPYPLTFGPYRVPSGHYFVMGDHRDRSQDSRTWPSEIPKLNKKNTNLVQESDILGRVSRVLISCQETVTHLHYVCHPEFMRWSRSFLSIYYP